MKRSLVVGLIFLSLGIFDAMAEPYPWEILKDGRFVGAYRRLLGAKIQRQPWLAKLNGPATPSKNITVGQSKENFLFLWSCKPHSCDTDNISILYSPDREVIYARLTESGVPEILGNPPSEVRTILETTKK